VCSGLTPCWRKVHLQRVAVAQGHGTVQQVFQLAHIARQRVRAQLQHAGRQRGHRHAGFVRDARQQASHSRGRSSRRSRSGGTRISITFRR
jgi:hypothetical protein